MYLNEGAMELIPKKTTEESLFYNPIMKTILGYAPIFSSTRTPFPLSPSCLNPPLKVKTN